MDLGSSRGSGGSAWGQPREGLRRTTSGGAGESSACRLPPLPRPPSAEDIDAARQHLVLLKAKMPQRLRLQRDRSAGPPPRARSPSAGQLQRGRSVPPRPGDDLSSERADRRMSPAVRSSSPNRRNSSESRRSPHSNEHARDDKIRRSADTDGHEVSEDRRRRASHGYEQAREDRRHPSDVGDQAFSQDRDLPREAGRRRAAESPHGQESTRDDRRRRTPDVDVVERPRDDRRRRPPESEVQEPREESRRRQPVQNDVPPPPAPYSANPAQEAPPLPAGLNLPSDAFGEPEPGELVECEGCGRKFREEALERHAKICKKVFQDKRKAFNSAANRLGELENADQLVKNAKKIEKEVEKVKEAKPATPENNSKPIPAWKKKSLEFRAAMLASKALTGDAEAVAKAKEVEQELVAAVGNNPVEDPSKKQCPHCGRSFNIDAAQRHIDICLKTFGGKNKRLVRGGGMNCNSSAQKENQKDAAPISAAAQVPTAARNARNGGERRTNAPAAAAGGRSRADEPPPAAAHAPRAGSRGPPPARGEQNPPSRESRAKALPPRR